MWVYNTRSSGCPAQTPCLAHSPRVGSALHPCCPPGRSLPFRPAVLGHKPAAGAAAQACGAGGAAAAAKPRRPRQVAAEGQGKKTTYGGLSQPGSETLSKASGPGTALLGSDTQG